MIKTVNNLSIYWKKKLANLHKLVYIIEHKRRAGWAVEGDGLENRYTPRGYRGFESLALRQFCFKADSQKSRHKEKSKIASKSCILLFFLYARYAHAEKCRRSTWFFKGCPVADSTLYQLPQPGIRCISSLSHSKQAFAPKAALSGVVFWSIS